MVSVSSSQCLNQQKRLYIPNDCHVDTKIPNYVPYSLMNCLYVKAMPCSKCIQLSWMYGIDKITFLYYLKFISTNYNRISKKWNDENYDKFWPDLPYRNTTSNTYRKWKCSRLITQTYPIIELWHRSYVN